MSAQQSLKIVTLNTWQKCGPWQERWQAIIANLEQYQADVVAFQELFDDDWRNNVAERAGYSFVAAPSPSNSGLVVLSRFPIVASELHQFAARSPMESYCRYLLWAKLAWHGEKIQIFNTHLSWMPEDYATRLGQMREIAQHIEAKRHIGPILLVGDLNATPDSEEVRHLLAQAGLLDTFAVCSSPDAGITWAKKNHFTAQQQPNLPDRRIDYILAAGDKLVSGLSACRVVFTTATSAGIFPSDHFGVMAEFTTRQK